MVLPFFHHHQQKKNGPVEEEGDKKKEEGGGGGEKNKEGEEELNNVTIHQSILKQCFWLYIYINASTVYNVHLFNAYSTYLFHTCFQSLMVVVPTLVMAAITLTCSICCCLYIHSGNR